VLSQAAIIEKLTSRASGLAITPILDAGSQIGEASVDVRLGPDFIVTRRDTGLPLFDPVRVDEIAEHIRDYQDYVRRPLGSAFYLHPGEFAIARTLEAVTLPVEPVPIGAEALGRSSWGRLGLIIATATLIQPGFSGTITLELTNVGSVPIVLYVGVRIAQISLYEAPET